MVNAHGQCFPTSVQKEDPYSYMASLIDALAYGQQGLNWLTGPNLKEDLDILVALRKSRDDYLCAASQAAPYSESKNEIIRKSASGTVLVFSVLAKQNDDFVNQYSATLNPINDGTYKPGTVMEKHAEMKTSYDSTWMTLVPTVILATYAVVEADAKTHLMSRLALTTDQREELKRKLRSAFGYDVAKGTKDGQSPVIAAAASLYDVIGDSRRQTRDQVDLNKR
jgi:hypothetical protein